MKANDLLEEVVGNNVHVARGREMFRCAKNGGDPQRFGGFRMQEASDGFDLLITRFGSSGVMAS